VLLFLTGQTLHDATTLSKASALMGGEEGHHIIPYHTILSPDRPDTA
jgi:hypothetical protein